MVMKKILLAAAFLTAFTICAFQNGIAEAKANVEFQLTNVILEDGKCEMEGFFYNTGDTAATVTSVRFFGTLNDVHGNILYTIDFKVDSNSADLSQCVVPANGKYPGVFTLHNAEVKAYHEDFHASINYEIEYK